MIKKMLLYMRTIRNMKPVQVVSRIKKVIGIGNSLGVRPIPTFKEICAFESVRELDYDAVFLSRFPIDEFVAGKITFLHESEQFDWGKEWNFPERSALWNFNLHYFEFIMPLVHAYEVTHSAKYLETIKKSISGWIENNPRGKGPGWAPYTIAMRLVYWFSCFFSLSEAMDAAFRERMINSMYEQYVFLAGHLEKDLLANHYFEDLKALVLCAIAFRDEAMLNRALTELKKQCREQILPDGMHFELSPMYHKIILEAVLRVSVALRSVGMRDDEIEGYLPKMSDVAYTFECGLERVPLFNDGGNNVAKSLDALMSAAKNHFDITPECKDSLTDSGYYFFRTGDWTLIIDAGEPRAKENPGHVHCDAMSFELFRKGHPVLVNCGTYAYQSAERTFFRSTEAHNTLSIADTEQAECWSTFRMGRGSSVKVLNIEKNNIRMLLTDQHGNIAERSICLTNRNIIITDTARENELCVWLHMNDFPAEKITASGEDIRCQEKRQWYSEEYGARKQIDVLEWAGRNMLTITIDLAE